MVTMGAVNDKIAKGGKLEQQEYATACLQEYMIKDAVTADDALELRRLINYVDVNTILATGNTLLIHLIKRGRHDLAKLLIDEGADVNLQDETGSRPLHTAVRTGSPEMVSLLLETGSDVIMQDVTGLSALHVACIQGPVEIVRLLISAGSKTDQASINEDRMTACMIAATQGLEGCLDLLLYSGAKPDLADAWGLTALHMAVNNVHLSCVMTLIHHNCKVNLPDRSGITPHQQAAIKNSCNILESLVSVPTLNSTKYSLNLAPLSASVMHNCIQCVNAQLDAKGNIEQLDKYKRTPLFYAIADTNKISYIYQYFGMHIPISRLDAAKCLLARGASVSKPWKTKFWDSRNRGPDTIATYKLVIRATGKLPDAKSVSDIFEKICSFGCLQGVQLLIQAGHRPTKDLEKLNFGSRPEPCRACLLETRDSKICDELSCDTLKEWILSEMKNPPSLKHLSRLQYRKSLSPNVIYCCNKLPIDSNTKQYITLLQI